MNTLLSHGSSRLLGFAMLLTAFALPAKADVLEERHVMDANDLAALEARQPEAAEALKRGEADFHAGKFSEAVRLFQHGMELAPRSALLARRSCQALLALGKRESALAACTESIQLEPTAMSFRTWVLVAMSVRPTGDELALAYRNAEAAKRKMPDQPWGYAADFDIATRIGDEKMQRQALEKLKTIAPGHYETERAVALMKPVRAPSWALALWGAFAGALVLTVAHAAWSFARRKNSGGKLALSSGVVALTLLAFGPSTAHAEESDGVPVGGMSKFKSDSDPRKAVPNPQQRNRDPLNYGYYLMDLADRAEKALEKNDYRTAALQYEAMAIAVPDVGTGFRRACDAWEKAKDLERAIRNCRGVLAIDGVMVRDYGNFARLLLSRPTPLAATDVADLAEIAAHLGQQHVGAEVVTQITCELGARLEDANRLKRCVQALGAAPSDPKKLTYTWALAIAERDFGAADRAIESAKAAKMPKPAIDKMIAATDRERTLGRRFARVFGQLESSPRGRLYLGAGGAMLLLLGALFLLRRSRRSVEGATGSLVEG